MKRPRITHVAEMDDADRRGSIVDALPLDDVGMFRVWFRVSDDGIVETGPSSDWTAALDAMHREARAQRLEAERIERRGRVRLLLWTNLVVWSGVALITYVELWR